MLAALDRYLKEHYYKYSIIWDREFHQLKLVLEGKVKCLRQQGKGKRSNAANACTDNQGGSHNIIARAILRTFKTSLVSINLELHSRSYDFLYLYYIDLLISAFLTIFEDFRRFSKTRPKITRTLPNIFWECLKFNENSRRLPKTFEEDPKMLRSYTTNISTV